MIKSVSTHQKDGVQFSAIVYNIDESKGIDFSCRKRYDS